MAAGAVNLRKSHDIVILSFCNTVKGQANDAKLEKVSKNRKNFTAFISLLYTTDLNTINIMIIVFFTAMDPKNQGKLGNPS